LEYWRVYGEREVSKLVGNERRSRADNEGNVKGTYENRG
jgi:hypothetical protein